MSDDLYFEPPSRLQLADKLAHLLRFSNTFVVLSGVKGSGLTSVVSHLIEQIRQDSDFILSLSLDNSKSLGQILELCNRQMDKIFVPSESVSNDQLTILHHKIESLSESRQKLLVFIDNADYLNDETIECLVNLQIANSNNIAILVAGLSTLSDRITSLTSNGNQLANYHNEILSPFNQLETEEFIHQYFVRGSDFNSKQLSAIYKASGGYPGRISSLTREMIKTGKIGLGKKNGLLPVPHLIGIGVLVLAIITASTWQIITNTPQSDQENLVVNSEDSSVVTEHLTIEIDESNEQNSASQALDKKIAQLTAQIESHKNNKEVIEIENEHLLANKSLEFYNPDVNGLPNKFDNSDDGSSISIETADQRFSEREASSEGGASSDNLANDLEFNQKTLTERLDNLTDSLKKNIIESMLVASDTDNKEISIVDGENVKPVIQTPTVKKRIIIQKKVVDKVKVKTNTKLADITSNKILTSVSAIQKWPVNGHTLQLLAAGSEDNLAKFLASAPQAERMYLYRTILNNKPWYVVIYGQYSSSANATFAITKLPNELKQLKPWVKSIKSVKNAIK